MSSDSLNTNLLGTSNKGLQVTQQIGASVAAGLAVGYALKKGITKGLKSAGIKEVKFTGRAGKLVFKMLVSEKTQKQLAKSFTRRMKQQMANTIKGMGKKALEAAGKAAGKGAVKAAEKGAVKAAEKGAEKAAEKAVVKVAVKTAETAAKVVAETMVEELAVGGAICAATGPETLGIGCAVAALVEVLLLAFDMYNLIISLLDTTGITVLIHKQDIDDMAKSFRDQLLQDNNNEAYLEDEIFFDPLLFVFNADPETHELTVDPVWGKRYNDLQDEYMKSIGITGDWRSRVQAAQFEQPEPTAATAKARAAREPSKGTSSTTKRNIIIGIIVAMVLIVLLLLVI